MSIAERLMATAGVSVLVSFAFLVSSDFVEGDEERRRLLYGKMSFATAIFCTIVAIWWH